MKSRSQIVPWIGLALVSTAGTQVFAPAMLTQKAESLRASLDEPTGEKKQQRLREDLAATCALCEQCHGWWRIDETVLSYPEHDTRLPAALTAQAHCRQIVEFPDVAPTHDKVSHPCKFLTYSRWPNPPPC
jgi:hypothetical protein